MFMYMIVIPSQGRNKINLFKILIKEKAGKG